MKIILDDKVCIKHKLTLQEMLIALSIREGRVEEVINNLLSREVIVKYNDKYSVTQNWSDIIDEILCDSSGGIDNEERLSSLAKQMRECFPEGKMPGTAYYYRCNNREVMLKLKKFFMQYGNYTDDKIIAATKKFVASYKGEYRFLPLIKYFISKNKTVTDEEGINHIQEVSELASYLENMNDNDDIVTIDSTDDWLMNSRN